MPRNNRSANNHWVEMKGMTTKSGIGGDGTGCLNRHRSRVDTVTATFIGRMMTKVDEKQGMRWDGMNGKR